MKKTKSLFALAMSALTAAALLLTACGGGAAATATTAPQATQAPAATTAQQATTAPASPTLVAERVMSAETMVTSNAIPTAAIANWGIRPTVNGGGSTKRWWIQSTAPAPPGEASQATNSAWAPSASS